MSHIPQSDAQLREALETVKNWLPAAHSAAITAKLEAAIAATKQQLLSEIKEKLPNRKTDISGYHGNFAPEQLTRITASNRAYNQAIDQVVEVIERYMTKEESNE